MMIYEKVVNPDLSTSSKEKEKFFDGMKENVKNILLWKMPHADGDTQNERLEELSGMFKKIEALRSTTLSPKDAEFLKLMERYYYVVARKPEFKSTIYKNYLRLVRDDIGTFYLDCVLRNDYDISHNPLNIPISELLNVCVFVGKKYAYEDGGEGTDRIRYFQDYKDGKKLKLLELLKEAKKGIPDFKKEKMNIPLFLSIFDRNDEISKDTFTYILADKLGFTKEEVSNINDRYLV